MCPPVVRFLTKILHPNVSRHGDVGIDSIHHNWSLALTISKVLISVQSLLTDPYCQVSKFFIIIDLKNKSIFLLIISTINPKNYKIDKIRLYFCIFANDCMYIGMYGARVRRYVHE